MSEDMIPDLEALWRKARELRTAFESGFSAETAIGGTFGQCPSAGQCAVSAVVLQRIVGGSLVSARVSGESHWFNRVSVGGREFDLDITGDQFGGVSVAIEPAGRLYAGTRVREDVDVNAETLARAGILAHRVGLTDVAKSIVAAAEEHATHGRSSRDRQMANRK